MFDLSHLPPGADVQIFLGRTNTTDFSPWVKPRSGNFLAIWAVGSGGGGGGGFSAAIGSTKGGGGGGGSGGITFAIFLFSAIPDRLYVHARGAVPAGTPGVSSYVVVNPDESGVQSRLVFANGGGGGGGGTNSAGGGGGSGASAAAATSCPLINLAVAAAFAAGQAGAAGQISGTPNDTSIGTGVPVLGGAGGGGYTAAGTPSAGGGVAFSGYLPDLPGGAAGASPGRGSDGIWLPPYFFGGTGGGGTNTAATTGGAGGNGVAPGTGGGGGGGGITGGAGGDSGPGMIIMAVW